MNRVSWNICACGLWNGELDGDGGDFEQRPPEETSVSLLKVKCAISTKKKKKNKVKC